MDLNIAIVPDGEFWYAQALEVDCAAQGSDPADALANLKTGLSGTIKLNLEKFGSLDFLTSRQCPEHAWRELLCEKDCSAMRISVPIPE